MNDSHAVRDQLEAFVAGQLCGPEAEELRRLITSEPDVARAYAEAKLRAERQTSQAACCGEDDNHEAAAADGQTAHAGTRSSGLFCRIRRLFGGSQP